MRCLYREKRFYCGDYLEVDIYPVFEYQRGRSKKRKPTSETQKKLNQRNAERKLIRLLNTNFTKRDIRFDLTYSDECYPDTPQDAQRELQNFLRRIKRYRKRHEMPDLKYVAVTEIGKRTARVHHHIVMSGGIDINTLADIWGRGYTTAKPLQFNEHGIIGIAKYMVKEPILGKRWCASRNLEQPKESQRDGRITQRKVREFHDSGSDNREEIEQLYEGYSLADIQPLYNDVNGGYYLTVRMYKNPKHKKRDAIGSYYSVACKETNLCSGHFIRTKHYNQKSDAIDAWNTRSNEKGGVENG